MALAKAPFGLRPVRGQTYHAEVSTLYATHAAFGKYHPLIMTDNGIVPLADETPANQTAIVGVSLHGVALNVASRIEYLSAKDCKFEIQADDLGSTFGIEAAEVGEAYALKYTTSAPDTRTGLSVVALTRTGAAVGNCVIIQRLADIPGNKLDANTYPIWVVKFNTADIFGAAGL